jgi:hypothetical protein
MSDAAVPKLSSDQADLLTDVLASRASHLLSLVPRLAKGLLMTDEEADEIENVLALVMTTDELTTEGELTPRGKELDELIGITRQLAASFHASED